MLDELEKFALGDTAISAIEQASSGRRRFFSGAKFSVQRLRIVRIAERNCRDIGARNAANRQSIIAALSGMSLPIYSMNF